MHEPEQMLDVILELAKKLYFPESWLKLDMKLSRSEMLTILYLDRKKEMTMTELVGHLNVPMSTATGIADRLVRNRYIRRSRSASDRRIVTLKLTEDGIRLIAGFKQTLADVLGRVTGDLTEEEKQMLRRIVSKVVHQLQEDRN